MYRFLCHLGSGVNGQVILVEDKQNWKRYAVKKLKYDEFSTREIYLWRKLHIHNNIVDLKFVHLGYEDYFVFMEPMLCSLAHYIKKFTLCSEKTESILHGLLQALKHCHDRSIIHRDIKPDNILLNVSNVKLCDFSLSGEYTPCMTPNVVTLWYRSPELLFGCTNYTFSVDIWSVGCVLYEMMSSRPPFIAQENSELSQLKSICSVIGNPSDEEKIKMNCEVMNIDFEKLMYKDKYFENFPNFLHNIFKFDFTMRPSANDLLAFCSAKDVIFFQNENYRASLSESLPEDWKEIFSDWNRDEYSHLL